MFSKNLTQSVKPGLSTLPVTMVHSVVKYSFMMCAVRGTELIIPYWNGADGPGPDLSGRFLGWNDCRGAISTWYFWHGSRLVKLKAFCGALTNSWNRRAIPYGASYKQSRTVLQVSLISIISDSLLSKPLKVDGGQWTPATRLSTL